MINNIDLSFLSRLGAALNKKKKDDGCNLYDFSEFRNDVLSLGDVEERLGRKKRANLLNLYRLAHYYRHHMKTQDGKYVGVPIPTTSEELRKRIKAGTQQNFSEHILPRAIAIDLIKCVDDTIRHHSPFPEDNKCKKYIFNDNVYELLKEWYDEQVDIGKIYEDTETLNEESDEDSVVGSPYTEDEIKSFRITPYLYSKPTYRTDEEIRNILKLHYPALTQLYEFIEKENQNSFIQANLDKLERKAIPSITREDRNIRRIEGIGLRDYSNASYIERAERKYYLQNILGPDFLEYDVPSSVYRVQYLLNTGIWLDDSIDIYEKIFGGSFGLVGRDDFKQICQEIYFAQSIEKATSGIVWKCGFESIDDRKETLKTLTEIEKAMRGIIGDSIGSEIFLYESRLYAEFAWKLMQEGFNVVQVFDCMYVNNLNGCGQAQFQNHCRELLKEIAENFYNNVYKWS